LLQAAAAVPQTATVEPLVVVGAAQAVFCPALQQYPLGLCTQSQSALAVRAGQDLALLAQTVLYLGLALVTHLLAAVMGHKLRPEMAVLALERPHPAQPIILVALEH
jgi:siroheme synthase